jgi:hypothetical protein
MAKGSQCDCDADPIIVAARPADRHVFDHAPGAMACSVMEVLLS